MCPLGLRQLHRAAGVPGRPRAGLRAAGRVVLYTVVLRHLVLVMAALAVCAVTAAQLRGRAGTQAPQPARSGDKPPADPGLVPLSVREVKHLLADALHRPQPPGHTARWLQLRRRHQARSRWFHQRARLARNYALVS